ncbi:MAG: hypothetical protein DSM106950_21690 [Stigonema ocellatum SAG 48.90 = DSM 106950]|nr:hypothetical protein [Stigonema ocellatum SAG 48.90 = DSM 106950]
MIDKLTKSAQKPLYTSKISVEVKEISQQPSSKYTTGQLNSDGDSSDLTNE